MVSGFWTPLYIYLFINICMGSLELYRSLSTDQTSPADLVRNSGTSEDLWHWVETVSFSNIVTTLDQKSKQLWDSIKHNHIIWLWNHARLNRLHKKHVLAISMWMSVWIWPVLGHDGWSPLEVQSGTHMRKTSNLTTKVYNNIISKSLCAITITLSS